MTSKDYQAAFDREFPEDVKLAIGMVIQNDYRTTANYIAAEEILGQFALHLSPQIRHYRIQSNLVEALRGAHPNIFTQVVRHSSGAEWYTVIQSNSFYLTVSMVKARGRLPKRTQFRSSNAQVNSLLSYLDEPVPDRLCAILTHVSSRDNSELKHLDLVIPDSRYKKAELIYDWLPLLTFQDNSAPVPNEVIDVPSPRFKEETKKKVEGA